MPHDLAIRGGLIATATDTFVADLGIRAEEAASAAAIGAIKGAGEVSAAAGEEVRRAVTGVIAGVKVVVKELFKSEERKAR